MHEHESELKMSSNCWICEGWTEHVFKVDSNNLSMRFEVKETTNIYVHFSTDKFSPNLMHFDDNHANY